jgi:hypothetical protein
VHPQEGKEGTPTDGYNVTEIQLEQGETLLLYAVGITEARELFDIVLPRSHQAPAIR